MHAPGFGLAFAFDFSAFMATRGAGFNMALGDFIPPFLLRRLPDFLFPAIAAGKRKIDVIAAFDEARHAVAVVGGKKIGIAGRASDGRIGLRAGL